MAYSDALTGFELVKVLVIAYLLLWAWNKCPR